MVYDNISNKGHNSIRDHNSNIQKYLKDYTIFKPTKVCIFKCYPNAQNTN